MYIHFTVNVRLIKFVTLSLSLLCFSLIQDQLHSCDKQPLANECSSLTYSTSFVQNYFSVLQLGSLYFDIFLREDRSGLRRAPPSGNLMTGRFSKLVMRFFL